MLKPAAIIFGLFFIVAGIGGFVSSLAPNGMLFGIFMVGPVHNTIHLASGVVALLWGGYLYLFTDRKSLGYFRGGRQ